MKLGFKAEDIEESDNNAPFPEGEYVLLVEKCEYNSTRAGGKKIDVQLQVVDPPQFRGRKMWECFNVIHAKPKVENISMDRFLDMSLAMGFPNVIDDTNDAINKTFRASVGIRTNEWEGKVEQKNNVQSFSYDKEVKKKLKSGGGRQTVSVGADHAQQPVEPVEEDSLPF